MSQSFNAVDVEKATRIIRHNMISNATVHLNTIDIQDVARMQAAGLYDSAEISHTDPDVLDLILSGFVGEKIVSCDGPYLFHFSGDVRTKVFAFELISGLFENDLAVRLAIYDLFAKGSESVEPFLTDTILEEIGKFREGLAQPEITVWQSAAILCFETIRSDCNYHLRAVAQSMQFRYNEGVDRHFNEVLYLDDRTLQRTIDLADLKLSHHRSKTSNVSNNLRIYTNISQVCSAFLESFDHLPISDLSFADFFFGWLDLSRCEENVWVGIWEWAFGRSDFISIYSACTIFLLRPSLVPKEKLSELVHHIEGVIFGESGDITKADKTSSSQFRLSLARHYTSFIKLRHPGISESAVGNTAWFLSHRVMLTLGNDSHTLDYFHNLYVRRAEEISSRVALQTNIIGDSLLAILTRSKVDPWRFSLLSLLNNDAIAGLESQGVGLERFQVLTSSLILSACAFATEQPGELPLNVKSGGIIKLAGSLSTVGPSGDYLSGLKNLYQTCEDLSLDDFFLSTFKEIYQKGAADQVFLSNIAKVYAGQRKFNFDKIWAIVSEESWLKIFFESASIDLSSSLFEIVSAGARSGPGQWVIHAPHIFAVACERQTLDSEKTHALFLLTVLSCIQSSTVSAIDRLLRGQNLGTLSGPVQAAIELLSPDPTEVPPWLVGRMRSVKSALV